MSTGGEPGAASPADRAPSGHRRRRAARRAAIDILYQADITGRLPEEVLHDWRAAGRSVAEYTAELVEGVQRGLGAIDGLLAAHAEEWTVSRMVAVDRTILRLACQEILSGVPAAVAIDEAVNSAKALSTEDSGRFVNGLLGRIARRLSDEDLEDPGA